MYRLVPAFARAEGPGRCRDSPRYRDFSNADGHDAVYQRRDDRIGNGFRTGDDGAWKHGRHHGHWSGVGKSECVLGLIERGYSLVSDDVTRFRVLDGRELVGTAPDLTRYHMEVRGLGIINVASIFGVGSIRIEKRLDLVVTLKDWQELEEVDRIGLEQEFYEILGIRIPHITIPVRTGRDLARLVEVAALDQKLKSLGQNSAVEFNQRLLNLMQTNKEM